MVPRAKDRCRRAKRGLAGVRSVRERGKPAPTTTTTAIATCGDPAGYDDIIFDERYGEAAGYDNSNG